ncbi:MAG: glycerol-3-phosphate dehydrogenase/oxidase [Rhizobiaceae bacterium]|nr:glycerol-3-phosphate dehydrogenase/oxidase [Rhizobiaceae bacterium]
MSAQRDAIIDRIRRNGAFDVVVVGGGINGIGVYRELALQGLRVLLVERNDFCSGCSAAPSRMIHGGLRYLENGEFDLVRESLRERDALLANAPHMVRPLPTTIPIRPLFSGLLNSAAGFFGVRSRPARRGALPIKIGLTLYDWTTRARRVLPRHRFRGARETLRLWPALSSDLRFSATYYDAWISYPERLGVELLLDTQRLAPESGALNYAEIARCGSAFVLTDSGTGEVLAVTARALVNATGAWLDESLPSLAEHRQPGERFVSGTKGSHLVIDNPNLYRELRGHMIFFEREDGRVCILFPYLGRVLAGSTDIRVEKADRTRCEPEERDYILEAVREVFPTVRLAAADVVFSYSGIRPLPRSDEAFTGRISRGHFVHRLHGAVPQFCMVGGKWTTFRAFAEQTADQVLTELGRKRTRGTIDLAIGGGIGFPADISDLEAELAASGVDGPRAAWLADAYGTRARDVLAFCRGREDDMPLTPGLAITAAEIAYLSQAEFVVELEDMLLRRTPLSIRGDGSMPIVERVAGIMAGVLGWSDERKAGEIATFVGDLAQYHGVSREMLNERAIDRSDTCA